MKMSDISKCISVFCDAPAGCLLWHQPQEAFPPKMILSQHGEPFMEVNLKDLRAIVEECTIQFLRPWKHIEKPEDFIWHEIDENFINTFQEMVFDNFANRVLSTVNATLKIGHFHAMTVKVHNTYSLLLNVDMFYLRYSINISFGKVLMLNGVAVSYESFFSALSQFILAQNEAGIQLAKEKKDELYPLLNRYVGKVITSALREEIVNDLISWAGTSNDTNISDSDRIKIR